MSGTLTSSELYKAISSYIIQPLVYLLFGFALLYFVYGAIRFIYALSRGDMEGKKKGQDHLLYGLLGLVIMLSVFGIMNLIYTILNGASPTDLQGKPLPRPEVIDHL